MLHAPEAFALRDGRCCTIRSAEGRDAAAMLRYMKIMLGETPFLLRTPEEFDYTVDEEAAILERRRDEPRSVMLLAELDGEIVACADIRFHGAKSRVMHCAELGISVRKDCWRLGLGSALMQRLIAHAEQLGFEQIELTVETKNLRAIALYHRFGFTVYGTRPRGMKYPDGSYDSDYLMVRMLDSAGGQP